MDCREVEEGLLEDLDGGGLSAKRLEIETHLAGCATCTRFAQAQKRLDAELSAIFPPPELSPAFGANLRKRIQLDPVRPLPAFLPDVVHFASCLASTILCAALLPLHAGAVLGYGVATTFATYLVLVAARIVFESSVEEI
jgi:anti-sigma factor RsiW